MNAGFSLLELLIALALFSLVSIGLTTILGTSSQVWKKSRKFEVILDQVVVRDKVRRLLESLPSPNSYLPADTLLVGKSDSLQFWTPQRSSLSTDFENYLLKLEVVEMRGVKSAYLMPAVGTQIVARETFASDLREIAFSYYGAKVNGEEADWHAEWVGVDQLPALIKITFVSDSYPLAPFTVRPAKLSSQSLMSLSSLLPPG
ncbi:prepilin-type N-terminal cleavage/methylation domain-containing protein [Ruegeria pomeroyi]|nr:prepilin-type N-terminal cleavage/methylation domain-containing protein [Ruegeria pomeroyi]